MWLGIVSIGFDIYIYIIYIIPGIYIYIYILYQYIYQVYYKDVARSHGAFCVLLIVRVFVFVYSVQPGGALRRSL